MACTYIQTFHILLTFHFGIYGHVVVIQFEICKFADIVRQCCHQYFEKKCSLLDWKHFQQWYKTHFKFILLLSFFFSFLYYGISLSKMHWWCFPYKIFEWLFLVLLPCLNMSPVPVSMSFFRHNFHQFLSLQQCIWYCITAYAIENEHGAIFFLTESNMLGNFVIRRWSIFLK